MVDAPGAVGGAVVSRARDWKEPIGRIGLVGQGVVATIVGLLAIRIAMGEKDEAATSEGAVAWLAAQPLGKFLLIALTVALFALALWRFLCAVMGDPDAAPPARPSVFRKESYQSGARTRSPIRPD